MNPRYIVQPLDNTHERTAFSCGSVALDRYLRTQAGQDMRKHLAVVYVLVDTASASHAIAGYYTLSATSIEFSALPPDITKRLPRYPTLPAMLIGRLAVDTRYQGERLGETLLMDALRRGVQLAGALGSLAIVVDAKDDAARAFYERYDFRRSPDHEYRLFLLTRTVAQVLAR